MLRLSCPYCNSAVTLSAAPPSGRTACPRCGDTFPVKPPEGAIDATPLPVQENPQPAARSPQSGVPPRRALLVALGMGLAGLGIGLVWSQWGRTPPPPAVRVAAGTAPGELAGLGYLPPGSNLVAAVRPGPALDLAARTGQDSSAVLANCGVPAGVLAFLAKAGVAPRQIDHVVVGVRVSDAVAEIPPPYVAAVVLREPLDNEATLLKAAGGQPRDSARGRPVYAVTATPLPGVLVKAAPTVWLFAKDESLTPADPQAGGGHLPPDLWETVTRRLAPDSAAWLATDSAAWAEKPTVKLGLQAGLVPKEWRAVLETGRAVAAGLTLGDAPRVRVFARCADEPAAAKLRDEFRGRAAADTPTGGAGEWAMFDAPFDPATGAGPWRVLMGGPPK